MSDTNFDPEGTFAKDSSIFGLPQNNDASLHLLPIGWEPTTSFKKGTSKAPQALIEASKQMDLYHPYFRKSYEQGIFWNDQLLESTTKLNTQAVGPAAAVIDALENEKPVPKANLTTVNALSDKLNDLVYQSSKKVLSNNKVAGLVGGDHSCPFGLIKALSEKYNGDYSILHIDAHFDFRRAYQGFKNSHASIMYNVCTEISNPPSIFQIGIRDFCESELSFANKNSTYILDQEFHTELLNGKSFNDVCTEFFKKLSKNIYISFDIDGLNPEHCPNTGTPVPGGLSYTQAIFIIQMLHAKGHKLVGFDLVEVSSGAEISGEGLDEIIGSRVLYELSCYALSCLD